MTIKYVSVFTDTNLTRQLYAFVRTAGRAANVSHFLADDCYCIVAVEHFKILGYVIYQGLRGQPLHVMDLYVDESVRGKGIGRELMGYMLQDADTFDTPVIQLVVDESNAAARAVYDQFTFITVGKLYHYYGRNQHGLIQERKTRFLR